MSPRTLDLAPEPTRGLSVFPAATAMVWPGVGHRHEAVAVPGVRLGPGDVLVELELATIGPRELRQLSGAEPVEHPLVLGHEQLGVVTALGPGVAPRSVSGKKVQLGDRVVWADAVPCGRCVQCRRGLTRHCTAPLHYGRVRMRRGWELSGAFATHAHVRAGTPIAIVPREVPAAVLAPVGSAVAVAVAALEAAAQLVPLPGEIVVVGGADLTALAVTAMAKDAGAVVIVAEVDASRRATALAFGADAVVDPTAGARDALSYGAALRAVAKRSAVCRVALEFSGLAATARELRGIVDAAGVLVLGASDAPREALVFDAREVQEAELTVRGVPSAQPRHLELAVGYVADAWRHRPFAELVAEAVPLARIDEAFALAASDRHLRVGVDPRG